MRYSIRIALLAGGLAGGTSNPATAFDGPDQPAQPRLAKIEDFAPADEFVMAGGIKTHFIHKGDQGRPVVLIHGFGASTYAWRNNLEALARRHRVYALDVKGFGLSAKPRDGRYNVAAFTEHLRDFLDVLKLDRPVLVGNSMGGSIAIRLALQHPERVGGLVLVDAAPIAFSLPRPPVVFGLDPAAVRPELVRALVSKPLVELSLKAGFHDPSLVTPEMVEIYHRPIRIEGAAEALIAMFRAPAEPQTELPPLRSLRMPVLIIWGKYDHVIPLAVAEGLSQDIPGARLVVLANSAHVPHEEEPESFNALVTRFVEEVP